MLLVRRRDEDGGKGLGFVREGKGMEENELEEGEAYSGEEEDEDGHGSCVEPDALGYIDEKLQDILGHFQKEFEGAMTVENLGAKMGEYGTFLPAYQRPLPNLTQSRSPRKMPVQNNMRHQLVLTSDGIHKNPSSISRKSAASAPAAVNLGKREMLTNTPNDGQPLPQQSSLNKSGNIPDQKTLKVRIKVGPDTTLARDNAAIYSGLGLDISPSSSFEDSLDGSGGSSPELEDVTIESPKTIIQIMTCFSVPGGLLLSPLQENLFQLTEKGMSFLRKCELGIPYTDIPENQGTVEKKGYTEKELKSGEKIRKPIEVKTSKDKIDTHASVGMHIGTGVPAQQEQVTETLNISMLPSYPADKKTELQTDGKRGSTKKVDQLKESKKVLPKNTVALPDLTKDKPELLESMMNTGDQILDNEAIHPRGKLNLGASKIEKVSNLNDESFDQQRGGQSKLEKPIAEHFDHAKQMPSQRATSRGLDGEKPLLENDFMSDRKIKVEASQAQSEPYRDFSKDNLSSNSSAAGKEQRKSSHASTDRAEKKPKPPKSRRHTTGDVNAQELQNCVASQDLHFKSKQKLVKSDYEKESKLSNQISKEKPVGNKVGNNLISGASVSEPMTLPLKGNASTDPITAPPDPIVIEENWVGCDLCQKWRLLPYGTNAADFPKQWHCSLLNWLPGMNSCEFSEEETSKALRALYNVPAPDTVGGLDGHNYVSTSGNNVASGMHPIQNVGLSYQTIPPSVKKKHKDVLDMPNHFNQAQFPSSTKKNQQTTKNRNFDDVNQCPFESDSLKKVGSAKSSKSSDVGREKKKLKQKEKHKNLLCHSSGGEFWGESEKNLIPKYKREIVHDGFRESKKPKKEISQNGHNDFLSDHDVSASGGLSAKLTGNNLQKFSDLSQSKDSKCDKKGSSFSSLKVLKDGAQVLSNGEIKEYFSASDVEKPANQDLSVKKRKVKEWQENQRNQEIFNAVQNVEDGFITKGVLSETELQGKRAKFVKSEGKGSKASKLEGKLDKKVTKIIMPQNKECPPDAMIREGHQFSHCEENAASKRHLEFNSFKRDVSCPPDSTAAHSSSSKVSGSRKCKSNIPESKGSPVESVSSSPLRVTSTDKLSGRRTSGNRIEAMDVALPITSSPKRFLDSEADGSNHLKTNSKDVAFSRQQKYLESHRGREHEIRGIIDFHEKETKQSLGGKSEESIDVKRSVIDDSEPADIEEIDVVADARSLKDQHDKLFPKHPSTYDYQDDKLSRQHNNSSSQHKSEKSSSSFDGRHRGSKPDLAQGKLKIPTSYTENKNSNYARFDNCQYEHDSAAQENLDADGPSTVSNHQKDSGSSIATLHKSYRPSAPEKFQAVAPNSGDHEVSRSRSDVNDKTEPGTRMGRSNMNLASDGKQETITCGQNSVSSPLKGSRPEVYDVDPINADALKVVKQSRHLTQNGSHHNVSRHEASNGPDVASPSIKDAVVVYRLMKEARDLKHSANRMKNLGQELESTGVYFAAALKFLHAAFLMETDSLKQGEATQLYHETAKLCDFVAREYEKLKEMAAAALAYKCVEVAYLKAAFHKNSHASKDRHDLQVALSMLPPGESPSSSASDVDSLNNQATLGKVTSAKGVSSPQIIANHAIASRHHSQVMKLLQYTNDLNCAFEATRKSQIAIAAAGASLGKDNLDVLSALTTVLNFNFHNVEELLRLVRLAQQSIGR